MKSFITWILTVGLISANEVRQLKEDLVKAMGSLIQSENFLRTDINNIRTDINNLNNAIRSNTKEIEKLNNYFYEIKQSRENSKKEPESDDDGKTEQKPEG